MGIDTIPVRADATTILATWWNVLRSVLSGDLVPRNASGVATANAGSLGTATYPFLSANITSGDWILGDIKMHHSYNGAAPIGHGWMLCDGRQITEALYNTEHGASTWATYIGTSPLLNKYLPNFTGRYPVGKATTPETGASPIATVGNVSSHIDISHTHTGPSHNHTWWTGGTGGSGDIEYDVNGGPITPANHTTGVNDGIALAASGGVTAIGPAGNLYTANAGTGVTGTTGSTTQSIQPDSVEVQYYMRVI